MRNVLVFLYRLPRSAAVELITVYQHTLSPDHGPLRHLYTYGYCRHEPTCSEYGKRTIMKKGLVIGSLLTAKRLLSCHPWAKVSDEKVMTLAQREHKHQTIV